jgi:hypothetical protein
MQRPPTPTDYRAETWTENGKTRHGVRKGLYGSGHLVETAGRHVRTWKSREAAEAAAAAMNEQAERTLRETALVGSVADVRMMSIQKDGQIMRCTPREAAGLIMEGWTATTEPNETP